MRAVRAAQIVGNHPPYRRALRLRSHRRPARDLVAFGRLDTGTIIELHIGNASSGSSILLDAVVESTATHHVPTLLVVGVLVNQSVSDIF